jgi:hypothetical protein
MEENSKLQSTLGYLRKGMIEANIGIKSILLKGAHAVDGPSSQPEPYQEGRDEE